MDRFAWLLGLRGVVQHARRNLIAGFAIAVGLTAVLTLIGYSKRIDDYLAAAAMYLQQPGHVAIVKKDGLRRRLTDPSHYSLKAAEVQRLEAALKKHENFDFTSPYLSGFGLIGNGCKSFPFRANAYSFEKNERILRHPEIKQILGDHKPYIQGQSHILSKAKAPVGVSVGLTKRLEKNLGGTSEAISEVYAAEDCDKPEVKQRLAKDMNVQLMAQDFEGRLNAIDAELVNEFTTGSSFSDNGAMTMGIEALQELLNTDKISYLAVFLKDRQKAEQFAGDIKVEMIQQKLDIDAYAWDDKNWNFNFYAGRNILFVTNVFASIVIFIVVILSIINTLNIGLVEARREIGTLRALGYTPKQIAAIFAIEAKCVAWMAVMFGTGFSYLLFHVIEKLEIPFRFPGASEATIFLITPPQWSYISAALSLVVIVVVTNFVIARRYASKDTLTLLDRGN
ncbi:MAG: ABC transporter permease [Proteobacteria bacterium]|nr:MAG: ABC transporter permease [Pseudomonadota bacterium]